MTERVTGTGRAAARDIGRPPAGRRPGRAILLAGVVAAAAGLFQPALADSLTDALIRAYQTNPALAVDRAQLRAQDESVPQARAELRPQVSAFASATLSYSSIAARDITDSYRLGLEASLTVFDNGRTANAIEAARNEIAASRARLVDTEQAVLGGVVAAFMNVTRDRQVVALAQNQVRVIDEQVRATRDRFEVGEVTITDVRLAEAAAAQARSALAQAEGALAASEEQYRAVVGTPPGTLQPPPPLPALPDTLEAAESIAIRQNPALTAARFAERAATFDVDRALAARGGSVQVTGSVDYGFAQSAQNPNRDLADSLQASIGVRGSVPLSTGGRNDSLIRQAFQVLERRQAEIQEAGRSVRQQTAGAWNTIRVARAAIIASGQEIEAARAALEAVREEVRLGARTTLDLLDAEQDLLDAETDRVRAQRDEYVAAYDLLAAMGLLTVDHLGLDVERYDPDANFQRVQSGPRGGYDTSVVDRIRERWQ